MEYGGTSEAEQDVTIRLDRHGGQAHICSTWPAWSRKLERLYGGPKRITERAGKATSAFWAVPLAALRVGRSRAGRILTPAERQAVRDRLQTARLGRETTANR